MQLKDKIVIFDGGFGSELEKRGLSGIPEDLNITHPEAIQSIHQDYASAGANVITTNTFGLNPLKYHGAYSVVEVAKAAIENARSAGQNVFFDIGPTGEMMKPAGILDFDLAYDTYKQVVLASRDLADGYILETFSDLYELKACLLAVKENSSLPVFATMTFEKNGRTLNGTSIEIMVNTLEGLGVDALGINCSLGPKELLPLVKKLVSLASVPVLVQPNRGIPELIDGKAYYKLSVEEYDFYISQMVEAGVSIIGGCCGTTPDFIRSISRFSGQDVIQVPSRPVSAVNSAQSMCIFDGVRICGERLNPTGKKKIKEALINQDFDLLIKEAILQQEAGADLLDVNLGLPQIDEAALMPEIIVRLQQVCDLPLQIDSSDPKAIEAGCRYYNGIPLINSVNGEKKSLDAILPIARKYGAVVLGLCMDERGIPQTARERKEIADHIIKKAEEAGIKKEKVMIDTLVVTASAQQDVVRETLKALDLVNRDGIATALGVSNVSFGLPYRPLLNRTFLAMALERGLRMPILNPLDASMMETVDAFRVLSGEDHNALSYIAAYKDITASISTVIKSKKEKEGIGSLKDAIYHGLNEPAREFTKKELETRQPLEIIQTIMIPVLDEIGKDYENSRIFLPQLIASAQAAKEAFDLLLEKIPSSARKNKTVLLATVQGDVHDIGKNIVKVLLESYGYQVADLGKDVDPELIVEKARELKPFAIGLSALMTTTVPSMEKTIEKIKQASIKSPVFVGGAVLNPEIARQIGADYYTKDALEMVKTLESL